MADLLELLAAFGIADASARSALSRMKGHGELNALSRDGVRGYALTAEAEEWFADGTNRIMKGPSATATDEWVLASFSVPEDERQVRYRIRSRLQDLGFGQLSGGLMIAPATIAEETARALERTRITDYVNLWRARHLGFASLTDVVADAWDLPAIDSAYQAYFALVDDLDAREATADEQACFVRYVIHINAWRELPFLDPGLPTDLLPRGWPAEKARARFTQIENALRDGARRHYVRVTNETSA